MGYTFTKYSPGGGASEAEVVQIVKKNFEGGVGYETTGTGTIIAEQTLTFQNGGHPWSLDELSLEEGVSYIVSFEGTEYSLTAKKENFSMAGEAIYVGNAGKLGSADTGEPFVLFSSAAMGVTLLMASGYDSVLFSLSGDTTITKKIDDKYVNVIGKKGTGLRAEVFNGGTPEQASGSGAHAEGIECNAQGAGAHAEGNLTQAKGFFSHAEGRGTIASGDEQHVQGNYNIEDTAHKYAHIVGNGKSDALRSNAHTVDWDGNAWFAGKIKIGGTGYDDPNAVELGGGGSNYVDVDIFPTENVDKSVIYRAQEQGEPVVYIVDKNGYKTFADAYSVMMKGATITTETYVVEALPDSMKRVDMDTVGLTWAHLPLYIIESTGEVYYLADLDEGPFSMGLAFGTHYGWVDSVDEIVIPTDDSKGYYIVRGASYPVYGVPTDIRLFKGNEWKPVVVGNKGAMSLHKETFNTLAEIVNKLMSVGSTAWRCTFDGTIVLSLSDGTTKEFSGYFNECVGDSSGASMACLNASNTSVSYVCLPAQNIESWMYAGATCTADTSGISNITLYYFA